METHFFDISFIEYFKVRLQGCHLYYIALLMKVYCVKENLNY